MAASCAVLVNFEPQQRNLYIKKKGCEGQTELVRGSISSFNHVCLCVCVLVTGWVRIAVIVKKAMRSDPDVHSLGMTDLRVIRLGVTDLTSLCLCQHLVILSHHQLLKHNQMVSDLKGKVGVDCAEGKAYLVKLVGYEGAELRGITTLHVTFSDSGPPIPCCQPENTSVRCADWQADLRHWQNALRHQTQLQPNSTFCIANIVRGMSYMLKNQTFLCWRSTKPLRLSWQQHSCTHSYSSSSSSTWLKPIYLYRLWSNNTCSKILASCVCIWQAPSADSWDI